MTQDAEPVVIRQCEKCGTDRILIPTEPGAPEQVRCDCGTSRLDAADLEALDGRGP